MLPSPRVHREEKEKQAYQWGELAARRMKLARRIRRLARVARRKTRRARA